MKSQFLLVRIYPRKFSPQKSNPVAKAETALKSSPAVELSKKFRNYNI